jgi:hypothetical protein
MPEVLSGCTTVGSWDIQLPELRNQSFWLPQDVLSCIRSTFATISNSTIALTQSRSIGEVYKALRQSGRLFHDMPQNVRSLLTPGLSENTSVREEPAILRAKANPNNEFRLRSS